MNDSTYHDRETVRKLTVALHDAALGLDPLTIMHVCGTHEHEIRRYGIRQLLPANVRLIAGPGCPVCITPASVIATAIELSLQPDRPIICSYGDMVRVPISSGSLLDSRGRGADIRVVYSIHDALRVAAEHPGRTVIFFSVGFETTAAPVAAVIASGLPDNLFVYCCHRYVPTAVEALTASDDGMISGYLLPGHASVITGPEPYTFLPERFGRAAALTGFEPVDILGGVLSIVRQIRLGRPAVENCYRRAIRDTGNLRAQEVLFSVFELGDAAWRGIGILPDSGLFLREPYKHLSALDRYGLTEIPAEDTMKGCICHLVLTGKRQPEDCPLFGTVCVPHNPQGPCMVGSEGTCRAHYLYPEEKPDA